MKMGYVNVVSVKFSSHTCTGMCSSRDIHTPPYGSLLEILKGRGVSKSKPFKGKCEAKLGLFSKGDQMVCDKCRLHTADLQIADYDKILLSFVG